MRNFQVRLVAKTIQERMTLALERQRFMRIQKLEMRIAIQQGMNPTLRRSDHIQVEVGRAGLLEVVAAQLIEAGRLAMVVAVVEKVRNIGL